METLDELGKRFKKTDKFRNNLSGHSYGDTYEELFGPVRHTPISLLEIGVKSGDSLRVWDAYFSKARIVGIDNVVRKNARNQSDRVTMIEADAYAAAPKDEFDIIVDDGPHTADSQAKAIQLYLPILKPGGVLVIEDLQQPELFTDLRKLVPDECDVRFIDLRHKTGRRDDMLMVVRKPDASPRSDLHEPQSPT